MYAYKLNRYQISSQQTDDTFYDIVARADGDTTPTQDEFRSMLQELLIERFGLSVHRETKDSPVYFLSVGKGGPKFKQSAPGVLFTSNHGVNGRNQTVELSNGTMENLVQDIRNTFFVDCPVLDRTNLKGTYDIKLEATPESRINRNPDDLNEISIFMAVRSELGLVLEPGKAPIEMLIVDSVGKPTAN
jgi:uncharacterized protein (TIGR03435 family)